MNKAVCRSASLMLAIVLTFSNFISGRATSQIPALMPDRTVNLAFFYKPPTNSDAGTVGSFGSVVLTAGDEVFRDQLIANGYSSTIPQYLRAEAIMDPGDCTTAPYKNQVAYKAGDFCDISANHRDWFLLDANGNRIRILGGNYYRMDPGNAGWRSFFVARLVEMQQQRGWSGVFLDNLEAGLNQIQRDGATSPRYPDLASYRAAVRGFVQYLNQNYSQPYNRPIMANIIARSISDEAPWFDYMQYMNGAMQERWAVDWNDTSYLSASNWNADMLLAERTQSLGKFIILVAPGRQADLDRQRFAYASYLLISNGKAAFRYSNSSSYREVWMYDNYNKQIGTPRGARYQVGTTWRRDFTNGYVIVDPTSHTATIYKIFDEKDPAFSYSNGWTEVADQQAYHNTFKRTQVIGSTVTLSFTGQKFTVIYKTGPLFGKMDIFIDGTRVHTLNQNTSTALFQQRWSYGGTLSPGTHQLKLVFSSGPADGRISLDAVSIP